MEKLLTVTMGRGVFLRAALILAGGTSLDLSFPRGRVYSAEIAQARKDGKAMEGKRIQIYSAAKDGFITLDNDVVDAARSRDRHGG